MPEVGNRRSAVGLIELQHSIWHVIERDGALSPHTEFDRRSSPRNPGAVADDQTLRRMWRLLNGVTLSLEALEPGRIKDVVAPFLTRL